MTSENKPDKVVDAPKVSAEKVGAPVPFKEAIQVYDDKKTGLVDKLVVSKEMADGVCEKAMANGIYLKVTDSTPPGLVLMVNNVEIPDDSPEKKILTVSVTGNEKWQENLAAALEKAILQVNKPRFYSNLKRKDQSAQSADQMINQEKPQDEGKIHFQLAEEVKKIDEKSAQEDFDLLTGKPQSDGKEGISIEDIRYNTRLLNKKKEGATETSEDEVKNLKNETARRIKAYTTEDSKGWLKLNYAKLGSDKRGMSHELYVGLGDILLDYDVQNILVERDGQIVKAHRGVATSGNYPGRVCFLDENNEYVATHTGDKFRILSNDQMKASDYVSKFREETSNREKSKASFKTNTVDLYVAEKDVSMNDTIALKNKEGSVEITNQVIQDATSECHRTSPIEKAARERKNLMKCLNYIAKEVGVPASGMLAVIYHECGIKFPVKEGGDGGLASGMGQMHPEAWASVKKDPKFSELVGSVMKGGPEKAGEAGRNKNIFVDLVGVAIFMKNGFEKFGFKFDSNTPESYLTEEQVTAPDGSSMTRMGWVRMYYHVPSYAGAYAKSMKTGNMEVVSGKAQNWLKEKMPRYMKLSENTAIAKKAMDANEGGSRMA